ncbi:hypothetical protein [Pantoea sp.]|uniref:hypothetical protein n=1 Tax=Pantoea sp. TaxID=69393 RepID=UPI0028A5DE47|nr:hypothetical protein [Pantoea sp.]
MSKKQEFLNAGVTKISFSFDALEPIRQLYYNIMNDSLDPFVDIGIKAHEDYSDEFKNVSMRWYFAKSPAALGIFRTVLDGCELALSRDIIGNNRHTMRVVQANIIETIGSYPVGRWHSDFYHENLGNNESGTLLTPLFPFQTYFGGLETTAAHRDECDLYDELTTVHKYQEGQAILFDGTSTIHRTQSYNAYPGDKRILVCWQFGCTREELQPVLSTIGKNNGDPMFFHEHDYL